MIPIDMTR